MKLMQKVRCSRREFKARTSDSSGIKCAFSVAISHRLQAAQVHSKENEEEETKGRRTRARTEPALSGRVRACDSEYFDLH